jgi:NADPH-dependent 2,4-dienoyl-CoA reductase/sulfur reductase-like enzyme/predicted acylesterase/phospholipase RssA
MTKKCHFLLIGGGLASAFAAEALRREGEADKIVMLTAEAFFPYYRPQLPKAFPLGNRTREQLTIFDADYYQKNDIEVLVNTKALAIDSKRKIVKTDHAGNIHFKKLLIATGCTPKKINIPGAELAGVHYLRTLSDVEAFIERIHKAKKAIIYGTSFITIELASSLSKKGIALTIIAPKFNISNFKVSAKITTFLTKNGVQTIVGEKIAKINGKRRVQSVETNKGKKFACDFIVVDMGLNPNTGFLKGSGIDVDNGVVVNQYMQTNIADIYAAGDVVKYFDPILGKFRQTAYGDTAIKQGKIAAVNMLGAKHYNRTASYLFFNAFGTSIVIIGDATDAKECLSRGSSEEKNFAYLCLKDNVLQGAIFIGRPITEIKAAESLIINHINLRAVKAKLTDISFQLEPLAVQTLLTLQGGGALGAFECGVVKAMEESGIYPDIVAGISIGAFNSAIIASNPKKASAALEAFWDELSLTNTPDVVDEQTRRFLSSWQAIVWGSPIFFHPRWMMPFTNLIKSAFNWTSFYDHTPIKKLLCKYVDFKKLKKSPIRLLAMAVNVETSEFEIFDSYTDDITADHILASGSLPPAFPWTTIKGNHYWDGGIVTNTPLDSAIDVCGSTAKKVYIVDLYPRNRCLPQNMIEVLSRKDEILFSEKMRTNLRTRDMINNFKQLIKVILRLCEPADVQEITQLPTFIQTMGDPGVLSVTRIVREVDKEGLYSWDSDFSRKTIEEHKAKGYDAAKKILHSAKFRSTP